MLSRIKVAGFQSGILLGAGMFALALSPLASAQTLSLDSVPAISLSASSSVSAVSIDASSGNVTVRSSSGTLNQCSAPNTTPVINSFGPTVSSVLVNGAFSISWNSSNTSSCSPAQGAGTNWPNLGTLPTAGTQNLTAPATAGTIVFQLNCTNGTQTATQTSSIVVQPNGGGGGNCTPPSANGQLSNWNSTLGSTWPSYNDVFRQMISNGQWVALSFTASASSTQFGTLSSSHFPGDGDGLGQVSISTSAGCFTQANLGANCLSAIVDLPGVSWSNQASGFACKLTPGGSYNMNIQFPSCAQGLCGRDFGNIQQLLRPGESPQ